MRAPLGEELIHRREQTIGTGALHGAIAAEHPDSRRVGERCEWHDWHDAKDNGAPWPSADPYKARPMRRPES